MNIAAASSSGTSAGSVILSLVLLAAGIGLYFVPTIVALLRHVPNVVQIVLLNFFLGWSFIGWIIALIWAAKPKPAPASHPASPYPAPPGTSWHP